MGGCFKSTVRNTAYGVWAHVLMDSAVKRKCCLRRLIVWIDRLFPVSEIKSEAFFICSLKSIVIPRIIEILGSYCFLGCGSLSAISIESDSKLNGIESGAFQGMTLTSARVPATVTSIAADAFPKSCRVSGKSACLVL
jgi:hypothetical protein